MQLRAIRPSVRLSIARQQGHLFRSFPLTIDYYRNPRRSGVSGKPLIKLEERE